jgi:hypothetical protein
MQTQFHIPVDVFKSENVIRRKVPKSLSAQAMLMQSHLELPILIYIQNKFWLINDLL